MLSEEYIMSTTDGIKEIWNEWENDVIRDIALRLQRANLSASTTAKWRHDRLLELGAQREYIYSRLAKQLKISEKEVDRIFNQSVIESARNDVKFMDGIYIPGIDNGRITKVINPIVTNYKAATNNAIRNFTRSSFVSAANQALERYLDMAWLNVSSGLMTAQEASKQAIRELAKRPVILVNRGGRNEQLETVVKRAVRTGVNQASIRSTLYTCIEFDCDLVKVSSHTDARPTHAVWQGKVYSLTGKTKGYSKLEEATGLGTGEGLGGWNCRHTIFPYFEGTLIEHETHPMLVKKKKEEERNWSKEKLMDREDIVLETINEKSSRTRYKRRATPISRMSEEQKSRIIRKRRISPTEKGISSAEPFKNLLKDIEKNEKIFHEIGRFDPLTEVDKRKKVADLFSEVYFVDVLSNNHLPKTVKGKVYITNWDLAYVIGKHQNGKTIDLIENIKDIVNNYEYLHKSNNQKIIDGYLFTKTYFSEGIGHHTEVGIQRINQIYITHFFSRELDRKGQKWVDNRLKKLILVDKSK